MGASQNHVGQPFNELVDVVCTDVGRTMASKYSVHGRLSGRCPVHPDRFPLSSIKLLYLMYNDGVEAACFPPITCDGRIFNGDFLALIRKEFQQENWPKSLSVPILLKMTVRRHVRYCVSRPILDR